MVQNRYYSISVISISRLTFHVRRYLQYDHCVVTDSCTSADSRYEVKQDIVYIFAVYHQVTSLRAHLLQTIRPSADEFHVAHFISSICSLVTTTSFCSQRRPATAPPTFSFLTRVANVITLPFVGRSKGTCIATE